MDSGHQSERSRLKARRFGLRFIDPATEAEYHRWRIATAMPFAQMGFLGSAPSWAAFLIAVWWLNPASLPVAGPAIGGWVLLLLVLTALTIWPRAQPLIAPLAAFANGLAGLLVAWLLYEVTTEPQPVLARAGVMTGGVLVVMYFGFAIFRIPPLMAMAGVTPYLGFSLLYLYADAQAGQLDIVAAGALGAILVIAYAGGVFVCVVIEGVTRRSFVKDQIIRLQQRQLSLTRDIIRRYVPQAVAELIIQGDAARVEAPIRRRVTILFCDIVGFTAIADTVEPEVTTQVLSDYLRAMAELVEAHGGTLNEFAGDGFMALFGAPEEVVDSEQVRRSLVAALAMQARMPELSTGWHALGLDRPLTVRIGINTGMVSVGSYGSPGRMTYTAVGLVTNVAHRLQEAAEPGEVLISEATHRLSRGRAECAPRGFIDCKGVQAPVRVHLLHGVEGWKQPAP
ncbi:MAG: adenylate/guanylate cyclase domain-containing protein [Pseudomonadota bacterium]